MMIKLWYIGFLMLLPLFIGCDSVHEFPSEDPEDPMKVDIEVDITTTIQDITVTGAASITAGNVYPQVIDEDKELRMVAEFYTSSDNQLYSRQSIPLYSQDMSAKQSFNVKLKMDKYYVIIWREYVDKFSPEEQFFYNTENGLRSVTLLDVNAGNDDAMDCCFGKADVDLTPYEGQWNVKLEIPVTIKRPVAKYILITNDVAVQTEKLMRSRSLDTSNTFLYAQTRSTIAQYKCKVIYLGNSLYGFDCFTGKPNDAKAGMSFDATLELINEDEARIAFSYPFAYAEGNNVHVVLQIYDENEHLIQEVPEVVIPVTQGELTVLKSDYLTHEYPQGIIINQDYDGDFHVVLPD